MTSTDKSKNACDLFIFGASGDLSFRKIFSALFQLEIANLLHEKTQIIACDREVFSRASYSELIKAKLREFSDVDIDEAIWDKFAARVQYCSMDLSRTEEYLKLSAYTHPTKRPSLFYMAIPSTLYSDVCQGLTLANLINPMSRIALEKPIGHDRSSSITINDQVAHFFTEEQTYRIDHYLGKETVQNVLALRFANTLFSENWNNQVIERVEITVAEEIGVEARWDYYDRYGQTRDMLQNHLLQLLSLIAMEPPASLMAKDIRYEKLQVLKALRLMNKDNIHEYAIRGQYDYGQLPTGGVKQAYTEEKGIDKNSQTETLVALKAFVDNERWYGVPFFLLTGKRLAKKCSQVVINFKPLVDSLFTETQAKPISNKLIIRLQPNEGIALSIQSKKAGLGGLQQLQNNLLDLDFNSGCNDRRIADAYERLLLELMAGNQNLFVSRQEVEQAWHWIDNIRSSWEEAQSPLLKYPSGTWGPLALKELFNGQAHFWDEDAASQF